MTGATHDRTPSSTSCVPFTPALGRCDPARCDVVRTDLSSAVEQDENVAEAGAVGFQPIEAICIDSVTKGVVAYTDRPGSE
jgi:hypothetical protein